MERLTARRLSLLLAKKRSLSDRRFATSLEFLLSWKLKTERCPDFMWCDGVEFEDIHIAGKRAVRFRGSAWIGPEGVDNIFQVPLEAHIELKPSGKKFKTYHFKVSYGGCYFDLKRGL
ncbi:hypothetical protein [Microbulbifer sp. A4B17]|uniref:hypothetical protein n=1 Tax=Microbulbifer sp. A4B17 TaxID=359370 RepID=UPI0013005FDC|nr:hypothetical protein [Microbulbifer sp. A4B17]